MTTRVDWVVFDVGGTLVDETRMWADWARHMGVRPERMMDELDLVLAQGRHHREVFTRLDPGFDPAILDSSPFRIERRDFFEDALPALQALAAAGLNLGVAANQPEVTEAILRESDLPLAFALSSARAGVAKPDPAFFAQVATACKAEPGRIAYVGDRLDNDVLPANAAGMVSVFLPRGPWGRLQATWPQAMQAAITVERLTDLTGILAGG